MKRALSAPGTWAGALHVNFLNSNICCKRMQRRLHDERSALSMLGG
jgi:hypothetical protein